MGTGELSGKPDKCRVGVTCDGLASHPGGVAILLVASFQGNQDKLQWLAQVQDFTLPLHRST